jgi:hypothetical protein
MMTLHSSASSPPSLQVGRRCPKAGFQELPRSWSNRFAPNAVLLVGRLSAPVDTKSLLDCSFTDARVMPGWNEGVNNAENLGGWPARFIRGSFMAEQLELAVTTRYAVVGSPDQYLVQLTVTFLAHHADRLEFDVAAINDGLIQPVR